MENASRCASISSMTMATARPTTGSSGSAARSSSSAGESTARGGQKGTIVIKFDDGTTDSLLANRPTLWEVEQAGAWCFERPNDDDDDGEEPVEDEPEPVAADAEDEEDACSDDEMAADDD